MKYIVGDLEFPNNPEIMQPINITDSIVDGYVNLFGKTFSNGVDFQNTKFLNDVDFSDSIFKRQSRFVNTKFRDDANFLRSQFEGDANFWKAHFSRIAYFNEAWFFGRALFSETIFSDDAHFRQSKFFSDSIFWHSQFLGDSKFQDSGLLGVTSFEGALFKKAFYLTGAKFNQFDARWNSIKDALLCDEQVYRNLIRSYNNLGFFDDADNCYFDYKWISQQSKKNFFSKLGDCLLLISCGYGVRPQYTLLLSIIIILFFGLIYWHGNGIKKSDCPQNKKETLCDNQSTMIDALYFSLAVFISQSSEFVATGRYKYITTIERIFGWALLTVFIIISIRVAIR
jgi:hypothetical protein